MGFLTLGYRGCVTFLADLLYPFSNTSVLPKSHQCIGSRTAARYS